MSNLSHDLRNSFFSVFFIFLAVVVFVKLIGPLPVSINSVTTTKTNLFHAQGSGQATAVPDTALISFGVTQKATTVLQAKNQATESVNKIMSDLQKLGVEQKNVKTSSYNIYPDYDYSGRRQTSNGYRVEINLTAKVKPIEKANQALDAVTTDGANLIGQVQFVLDDDAQSKLENQARLEAIQKAKQKAQSLANATGVKLGRIVDVQESGINPPMLYNMGLSLPSADSGVSKETSLAPGENKVSITITLSYETY